MKVLIILCLAAVAVAQMAPSQFAPIPYSFNYKADLEDGGSSSHQEEGDGGGRVSGSYTVTDLEGHNRVVEYIADENGFRATVRTNEPGTANLNPADVIMESSADAGAMSMNAVASARPVAPSRGRGTGRFVLVPADDPRARGY